MDVIFTDVGCRISARIEALGLKQLGVCNKVGLSTTAMSNYCTGKRIPDTTSLYKLSSILGVSMEWLLTGDDKTNEDSQAPSLDLEAAKEKQGLLCDGSPLEDEEADMVAMYRLLPSHEQEDAFDLIYFKYKKHVEKKAESIYWTYAADKEKRKATADLDGGSQGVLA